MPSRFNNCRLRRAVQAPYEAQKVCGGPQEITQGGRGRAGGITARRRRAGTTTRLAGSEPAYELLDPSLRVSKPVKSDKTRQVVVPVYLTFMIKKLVASRSEADEDGISLVGTLIQRPLLYDLASLPRCSGKTATPYFATRVNEGETAVEGCFDERKVASTSQSIHGGVWRAASDDFCANLPMKLYSVFSAHPFHIMATEVMIELTSFTSTTGHELRPSILCHVKDFRNLRKVRDYDSPSKMDEMKKWEIMNSSPTVEYEADGDGIENKKPFLHSQAQSDFLPLSRRAPTVPGDDRADHLRALRQRAERRLFEAIRGVSQSERRGHRVYARVDGAAPVKERVVPGDVPSQPHLRGADILVVGCIMNLYAFS